MNELKSALTYISSLNGSTSKRAYLIGRANSALTALMTDLAAPSKPAQANLVTNWFNAYAADKLRIAIADKLRNSNVSEEEKLVIVTRSTQYYLDALIGVINNKKQPHVNLNSLLVALDLSEDKEHSIYLKLRAKVQALRANPAKAMRVDLG